MARKIHHGAVETLRPVMYASDMEESIDISPLQLLHIMQTALAENGQRFDKNGPDTRFYFRRRRTSGCSVHLI